MPVAWDRLVRYLGQTSLLSWDRIGLLPREDMGCDLGKSMAVTCDRLG